MVLLPFYQVGNEYDTSDPAFSGGFQPGAYLVEPMP